MTDDLLDPTLWREGQDFEAKEAQGQDGRGKLPGSFWESYSAMANSDGGLVVLGVSEREDRSIHVLGLGDAEGVLTQLWNGLNNPQQASVNLLGSGDARIATIDGKRVILVTVPRASRRQRPVFTGGNPLRGTYLRGHEGDYHCPEDRVRRMLADALETPRDNEVLSHFSLADCDPASLSAFRNLFRSTKPDHVFLTEDDQGLLHQLGGWRRDRATGVEGLTLAGLLMFGRFAALREVLPHMQLDYRELDPDPDRRWADRLCQDGSWSGNLFDFYRRVMPKLTAALKVPFQLADDLRRRDETHVHEALREALVNSLIHADWQGSGGVVIERGVDAFAFANPGVLRLPIAQIRHGNVSDCRNPSVQLMFQMIGAGDKAGSGFPKILRAWREQHWRAPLLEEDHTIDRVQLRLTMASLLPPAVLAELSQRFGAAFTSLDEASRLAVATAQIEGQVSNRRLQDLIDQPGRLLTDLLGDLCRGGLLEKSGRTTATIYRVPGSTPPAPANAPSMAGNDPSSLANDPSSAANDPSSATPPSPIDVVAGSERARPEVVQAAILTLCQGQFVRPEELAQRLNRVADGIRKRFLANMVRDGLLEQQYPEPTDPRQAYRTINRPPGGPAP